MATKVTILGEQPIEQEKKKIEFVYFIDPIRATVESTLVAPKEWDNIELIKRKHTDKAYDVMFAYDTDRLEGVIYLGHFNDGVV